MFLSLFFALKELALLVSYVKNNSFPQPLSEEEERQYLERSIKGDKDARRKLIEHNLRLVAHIVKKYDNANIDNDDLISIGTVGLIKGIDTFDLAKGIKLATYAARCIENEVLMQIRANKKSRDDMSLEEPLGIDQEGNELTLMDILGIEIDFAEKINTNMNVEKMQRFLSKLTPKERYVIDRRYGLLDGNYYTQREIARQMKISRSYVSRIEKKAIRKLLKEFKKL
ncbi:RNA polymerase, sigma 27/28 subunit, RpsK/SigK [Anaerobranca californiensis DSM 14826]|jgi:RNA polymerase sporulation-specific sigma factor|uniref:RNA polymerase sigma factor n=1 Tax=Anaerobranca californiensis DSM 14826 TaxID=1120989 RepID=A0A1M6LCU7_9FIRM|nr:RNA polymerase sporulation sigma factor SigK [Anaerobranca californiensis]SHJ68992.1 RNA polymerase, sigma 27/28 subunit, RpsK/SigK [Anaerobranca californiensis DSM 14826]